MTRGVAAVAAPGQAVSSASGAMVGTTGADVPAGPAGAPGADGVDEVGTPAAPALDLTISGDIGDSDLDADLELAAAGDITAGTFGDATNSSDGSSKVGTGNAKSSGNESTTHVEQSVDADSGLGLILTPQTALVVNAGVAQADTGDNTAIGNESLNNATLLQTDTVTINGLLLGDAVATSSGVAENESDGDACACSGDATASGNLSDTTLVQDLDASANGGSVVIVPTTGVVANLGAGVALTGLNTATGNSSDNGATTTQASTIDVDLLGLGDQVATSSGDAGNASDGTAEVGSGNARAIGNTSDTVMTQGAVIDGDGSPVISSILGTTANAGLGIADTGDNHGTGNDSFNRAVLEQTATGDGVVSNQGSARNASDGTARIGDPDCEPEDEATTTPTPTPPTTPGLPRTGGPLEVEAAIGLMLLLAGFGLRRQAKHAFRD